MKTVEVNQLTNTVIIPGSAMASHGVFELRKGKSHLEHSIVNSTDNATSPVTTVRGAPLDSLLAPYLATRRIALLKMNIEGAEIEAIQGMAKTIGKTDCICIACHDFLIPESAPKIRPTIEAFLRDNGFSVVTRSGDSRAHVREHLWGLRLPG